MKAGTENRRKTIIAGVVGAVALVCIFRIYSVVFGEPDAPAPSAPTAVTAPAPVKTPANNAAQQATNQPGGVAPGVEAKKLVTATSSLDPTLDEVAMLRTENLVYSGTGRNIFSAVSTPQAPTASLHIPKMNPRDNKPPPPPYTPPSGPPPLPPINLKFFGTATRPGGLRQVFLLNGEDVYLASQGDIVARKFKIGAINSSSVSVTDLTNNNTQTLPLQMQ